MSFGCEPSIRRAGALHTPRIGKIRDPGCLRLEWGYYLVAYALRDMTPENKWTSEKVQYSQFVGFVIFTSGGWVHVNSDDLL
jgi:hypothetical protein